MEKLKEIYQQKYVMQTNTFRSKFDAEKIYRSLVSELTSLLIESGIELILKDTNKYVIGQVALWYANDDRFSGNLRKGLLIRGGVGTGKTKIVESLIKVIFKAENIHAKFIHATDLQELYVNKNSDEIDVLKLRKYTVIDDLGVENVEVKNWGNTSEPFNNLFDYRYRHGMQSIITTNLAPSQIKETYGDRIADRFRETLNDFVLDGESLRK